MEFTPYELTKALNKSLELGEMAPVGNRRFAWYVTLKKSDEPVGKVNGFDSWKYTCIMWHYDNGISKVYEDCFVHDECAVVALTNEFYAWVRWQLWPSHPGESIREWYQSACPDDPEGESLEDIPFYRYMYKVIKNHSYYVGGVNDSVVRQRVQAALQRAMHSDGDQLLLALHL